MSTPLRFEQALENLQAVVKKLESGDVSLEDALKQFEEGVKLSRQCQSYLSEAEKRVEILTQSKGDSEIALKPFDPAQSE